LAGDDAPQAPLGIAAALALGGAAGHVGAGVGGDAHGPQQDGVQAPFELAVPAAVEPVAGHLPRGGRDRVGAGQGGKGRLGAEASGMRPADQHLGGAEGTDAGNLQQPGGYRPDQGGELGLELVGLGLQELDAGGGGSQRPHGGLVLQRPGRPRSQAGAGGDLAGGGAGAGGGAACAGGAQA